MNARSVWPVKIGLLLVALSWFSFTFYEFAAGVIHRGITWPVIVTDLPGTLGLGFRTGASFIAVITILFYIVKKDLSKPEAVMSLRWILVFEAANFVSLLPSGLWGLFTPLAQTLIITVESTLPCLVESILIPIVLTKLFLELNPNKPARGAIKWGLIAGTIYLFVFWLNYTCNWIGTIIIKGVEYVSLYPVNLFSFALTSIGLLLIALITTRFAKKSIGTDALAKLDFRRVGYIITFLGLYFNINYVLWLLFGSVGGWSIWYAWFLNHNMDLWILSAPLLGLPLLFQNKLEAH